jgi:hypothetical protein
VSGAEHIIFERGGHGFPPFGPLLCIGLWVLLKAQCVLSFLVRIVFNFPSMDVFVGEPTVKLMALWFHARASSPTKNQESSYILMHDHF